MVGGRVVVLVLLQFVVVMMDEGRKRVSGRVGGRACEVGDCGGAERV